MPDFSVLGTNHTGITVSNLDRAVAFYRDVLGFTLRDRGPRDPAFIEQVVAVPGADVEIAYMTAPGHTLELIEYRGPAGRGAVRPRPSDTGATHVAFNVDAIEAVVTAVQAAGFTVLSEPLQVTAGPNAGAKVVYTQDPDGVTLEFIQPPPRAASAPGTES